MFQPIHFLAIIKLDTIIGENYTIYDTVKPSTLTPVYTNTDGYNVSFIV